MGEEPVWESEGILSLHHSLKHRVYIAWSVRTQALESDSSRFK